MPPTTEPPTSFPPTTELPTTVPPTTAVTLISTVPPNTESQTADNCVTNNRTATNVTTEQPTTVPPTTHSAPTNTERRQLCHQPPQCPNTTPQLTVPHNNRTADNCATNHHSAPTTETADNWPPTTKVPPNRKAHNDQPQLATNNQPTTVPPKRQRHRRPTLPPTTKAHCHHTEPGPPTVPPTTTNRRQLCATNHHRAQPPLNNNRTADKLCHQLHSLNIRPATTEPPTTVPPTNTEPSTTESRQNMHQPAHTGPPTHITINCESTHVHQKQNPMCKTSTVPPTESPSTPGNKHLFNQNYTKYFNQNCTKKRHYFKNWKDSRTRLLPPTTLTALQKTNQALQRVIEASSKPDLLLTMIDDLSTKLANLTTDQITCFNQLFENFATLIENGTFVIDSSVLDNITSAVEAASSVVGDQVQSVQLLVNILQEQKQNKTDELDQVESQLAATTVHQRPLRTNTTVNQQTTFTRPPEHQRPLKPTTTCTNTRANNH
ncbi:uncharacterized protein PB18E9.04c-like [Penaeus monodon]|uniref:uncharacterized protein PB18E9.04c-like n=1 Tax=Penaeus monodon TaxID=6687 RepID=UPI0018A7D226|nr:uncharacterized protein PB18E9.04c-like [Penaeus monodon]